jgi:hypothetical protein
VIVRPTLSEQLQGLRHILDHVVAPEVHGDYAQQTLLGVSRALDMLVQRAGAVGPFLEWDNRETRAILHAIATRGISLAQPIDVTTLITTGDIDALDAENERLRAILATVIPDLADGAETHDLHAAVVAHLRERIARYPYASTGTLPSR